MKLTMMLKNKNGRGYMTCEEYRTMINKEMINDITLKIEEFENGESDFEGIEEILEQAYDDAWGFFPDSDFDLVYVDEDDNEYSDTDFQLGNIPHGEDEEIECENANWFCDNV